MVGIVPNKTISTSTKKAKRHSPKKHRLPAAHVPGLVEDGGVKQVLFGLMRRFIAISYVVMLNCMLMTLPLRDNNQ